MVCPSEDRHTNTCMPPVQQSGREFQKEILLKQIGMKFDSYDVELMIFVSFSISNLDLLQFLTDVTSQGPPPTGFRPLWV